MAFDVLEEAC
jgi:hypothetical protein